MWRAYSWDYMYVNVETASPPALHIGGHITKAPAVKITPWGPFIFKSSTSYTKFLSIIAKGIIAGSTKCLICIGMQWQFDQPQNATKKPITNKMGYKVIITTLLTQPKDYCIMVSMPSPTKHVNDVVSYYISLSFPPFLHCFTLQRGTALHQALGIFQWCPQAEAPGQMEAWRASWFNWTS